MIDLDLDSLTRSERTLLFGCILWVSTWQLSEIRSRFFYRTRARIVFRARDKEERGLKVNCYLITTSSMKSNFFSVWLQ